MIELNRTVTVHRPLPELAGYFADFANARISYHAAFEFHGLAKLAQPLLKGSLGKLGDDTMAQIARVLDGGPGTGTNPT